MCMCVVCRVSGMRVSGMRGVVCVVSCVGQSVSSQCVSIRLRVYGYACVCVCDGDGEQVCLCVGYACVCVRSEERRVGKECRL